MTRRPSTVISDLAWFGIICLVVWLLMSVKALWAQHPALVRVVMQDATGFGYGSGAIVGVSEGKTYIASAAHNFRGMRHNGPGVMFSNDPSYRNGRDHAAYTGANLLFLDDNSDVALLSVDRTDAPGVLDIGTPQAGQEVETHGFPLGGEPRVYRGHVHSINSGWVWTSATTIQGMSGGPAIADGKLIGTITGGDVSESTFSIPGNHKNMLERAGVKLTQCQGGWCVPRAPVVVQSRPRPKTRKVPGPKINQAEIIAAVIAKLKADNSLKGEKGDKGDKGDPGQAGKIGPPGLKGLPGEPAQIDEQRIAEIVREVLQENPISLSFWFQDDGGRWYLDQSKTQSVVIGSGDGFHISWARPRRVDVQKED